MGEIAARIPLEQRYLITKSALHEGETVSAGERLHSWSWSVIAGVAVFTMLASSAPAGAQVSAFTGGPFSTPVPADAAVDPGSEAMIARIARDHALFANLVEFAIPIYVAAADTPRVSVACTMDWGTCPFDGVGVPIPDGARPHSGSDGAMVVVDPASRQVFEFWQAAPRGGGQWTTSWGAINSLDGSGWGGNSTAAGASRLAGVIQIDEIAAGSIPHALAIQSDSTCAGTFRPPALKTDGHSTRPDCIPEGARIRLDPAVDVNALKVSPAARAVARALQTYGAFIVDSGGAPMSVSFQLDPSAKGDFIGSVYEKAGLQGDYDGLKGIPYDRLQVLA